MTLAAFAVVFVVAFLLGSNFSAYPTGSTAIAVRPKLMQTGGAACPMLPPRKPCPLSKRATNSSSSSSNDKDSESDNGGDEENDADDSGDNKNKKSSSSSVSFLPSVSTIKKCVDRSMAAAEKYVAFANQAAMIRQQRGPLKIAGFSRLWVPPVHGTGGMQFHALHLYSQFAVKGHTVHVFVTGPPEGSHHHHNHQNGNNREVYYEIDEQTHTATITHDKSKAKLTVHQVASSADGEYSPVWYENCLTRLAEVNQSLVAGGAGGGFDVVHSESWAAVANLYQIGLPAAVTWHGSMLDWFRNEINLIVHNFRMRGKMTGEHTAGRMKELGGSVAYEAYALLAVPAHIVISDAAAYDLRHVNLLDYDSVHTIYNGVNTKNFHPAADRSATRRDFLRRVAKWTGTADEMSLFLVGCGGRLDGIKGHHQLSVAMRSVLEKNKKQLQQQQQQQAQQQHVILLVAGRGHESTRYEKLKEEGFNVVMLGMLNQNELAAFYQSVDIFVDPFYQHHGLNTVQLEAALSGLPMLVTDLASAQTTVPCNGGLGLTFPLGEPVQLAARIEWMAAHPAERAAMGETARKRALMLFSSSVMAARYEHLLYEAVLNPKPIPAIVGKVVCRHAYPKMCYREPEITAGPPPKHK